MKFFSFLILLFSFQYVQAQQQGDFSFGKPSFTEWDIQMYDKDSSAKAVVLQEYGNAYLDFGLETIVYFHHHVRVKILHNDGFKHADVAIYLRKNKDKNESYADLKAVTLNKNNGLIQETPINKKNIIQETSNEYLNTVKFTFPDIRVGSVIEYSYTTKSPFYYNFQKWLFQSDIPKINSIYKTKIPEIFDYNASLKGYIPLYKHETTKETQCTRLNGEDLTCNVNYYEMKDIPAFESEKYMTAKKNFLSSINYELRTINYLDGHKDQITKEWKDADLELQEEESFGSQIKKERAVFWGANIDTIVGKPVKDSLLVSRKIYHFIQQQYNFNSENRMFCDKGIKQAFNKKSGNVADINLSLISALKYAGFKVEPVILSTRDHGLVTKIYPVISEFNYVIAHLVVGNKEYFLDATDDDLPYGMIPQHCLNGPGRVIGANFKSRWVDIPPFPKSKEVFIYKLKIGKDENLEGAVSEMFSGYIGLAKRGEIHKKTNPEEYIDDLNKENHSIKITAPKFINLEKNEEYLKIEGAIEGADAIKMDNKTLFINPFFGDRFEQNPFKSDKRLYPVDFAFPRESLLTVILEIPEGYAVTSVPQNINIILPENGGKYFMAVSQTGSKTINLSSSLQINQTLFSSLQYDGLKKFFDLVVKSQSEDIILKKK